jgi:hypothetical protein
MTIFLNGAALTALFLLLMAPNSPINIAVGALSKTIMHIAAAANQRLKHAHTNVSLVPNSLPW